MSTTAIIITRFIFFAVTLAFAIYEMNHAYEADPNDETLLD